MDFEFYRNFITVAETGNLTTASKKLALAQPGPQRPDQNTGALLRRQADPDCARQTPADPDRSRGSLPGQGRQICRTEETILLDMKSFNKKSFRHTALQRFSLPKAPFSSTPICVPLRPPIPKSASSSGKKPSAPRPDILRKTAVILPLPMRRCPHRSCLPPTKRRKNIFTPFTVRRQTAALTHSSR